MNLDITFCSNGECKNQFCRRHQRLLKSVCDELKGMRPISIAEFKECEHWRE